MRCVQLQGHNSEHSKGPLYGINHFWFICRDATNSTFPKKGTALAKSHINQAPLSLNQFQCLLERGRVKRNQHSSGLQKTGNRIQTKTISAGPTFPMTVQQGASIEISNCPDANGPHFQTTTKKVTDLSTSNFIFRLNIHFDDALAILLLTTFPMGTIPEGMLPKYGQLSLTQTSKAHLMSKTWISPFQSLRLFTSFPWGFK